MSDKKVTQLHRLSNPQGTDLLLIIDMKSDIPVSKNITLDELFREIKGNSVSINNIVIKEKYTPTDSLDKGIEEGRIFFDEDYLYIKVNDTEIKRVSLELF